MKDKQTSGDTDRQTDRQTVSVSVSVSVSVYFLRRKGFLALGAQKEIVAQWFLLDVNKYSYQITSHAQSPLCVAPVNTRK